MAPQAWSLFTCLLPGVLGQVFVGSNNTATPMTLPAAGKLSNTCNATFDTHVTCDPNLLGVAYDGYFPTTEDLTQLCTQSCLKSLSKLNALQSRTCSKQDVLMISGERYPATFTIETLLWTYNFTCRRDPATGDFCAPIFDSWADGKAANQSCSDCVLGTYHEQLKFPLGYDEDQASSFSSLTSSCDVSNYPVTSPAAATVAQNATVAPTPATAGAFKSCSSTYTIQKGDDCHSISRSQQVSTAELLYFNNLEAGCSNFPDAGSKLCMPHKCIVYTVKADDTCYGITDAHNSTFTMSQLISWNVDINSGCDNLEMLAGNQICVSFPGNASAPTVTGPAQQTMSTIPCFSPGATVRDDSCDVTTYETLAPWTWTPVNTITNSSASSTGSFSYSSIPLTPIPTFTPYAPSHYPDPTPRPFQTGMVSGCTNFWKAEANDSCVDLAQRWDIPVKSMYAWNPALNGDCSGLQKDEFYCMKRGETSVSTSPTGTSSSSTSATQSSTGGPPGPTQTGIPDDCNKWVMQEDGKYCQDMADAAGISLGCLYEMNPALNTKKGECQGLLMGEAYCIGTTSNKCK